MEAKIELAHHKNFAERCAAADTCVREMEIDFPALVDGMDNATELAYTAWPDRLYVVGVDGRILHKTAPGPWGFRAKKIEEALKELLPAPPEVEVQPESELESEAESDTATSESAS